MASSRQVNLMCERAVAIEQQMGHRHACGDQHGFQRNLTPRAFSGRAPPSRQVGLSTRPRNRTALLPYAKRTGPASLRGNGQRREISHRRRDLARTGRDCLTGRSKSTQVFVSLSGMPDPTAPDPEYPFSGAQKDSRLLISAARVFTLETEIRS